LLWNLADLLQHTGTGFECFCPKGACIRVTDRDTGSFKGFGFIKFATKEAAGLTPSLSGMPGLKMFDHPVFLIYPHYGLVQFVFLLVWIWRINLPVNLSEDFAGGIGILDWFPVQFMLPQLKPLFYLIKHRIHGNLPQGLKGRSTICLGQD